MDETDALGAWLKEAQGVELPRAQLREPAGTASRLGALAGLAANSLRFGAEPGGFYVVQARLIRGGNAP